MAKKKRLLFIEYNYIYAQLYRKHIPSGDFEVTIVTDGTSIVQDLKSKNAHFDVIVTNLFSPPPDGLTFFLQLTENKLIPKTFLILHELEKKQLDTFLSEHCPDMLCERLKHVTFINKEETKPKQIMSEIRKSLS